MRSILLVVVVVAVVLVSSYGYLSWRGTERVDRSESARAILELARSPADASYSIGGAEVRFEDGAVTTDDGTTYTLRVDVSEDSGVGRDYPVVIESVGSEGQRRYVAVAVHTTTGYVGSNAVQVSSSTQLWDLAYSDGVLTAEEGKAARYYTIHGATLSEVETVKPYKVQSGLLVIGHEVRSFTPCGGIDHWIDGSSRALPALQAVYALSSEGAAPYTPVPALLLLETLASSTDGFSIDYDAAVRVERVLAAPLGDVCMTSTPDTPVATSTQ